MGTWLRFNDCSTRTSLASRSPSRARSIARCVPAVLALSFIACGGGEGDRDGSTPSTDGAPGDSSALDDGSARVCIYTRDYECDDGDPCTRDTCEYERTEPPWGDATCRHEYFEGACTEFVDIAAGASGGCGVDAAGRVFCWGYSRSGCADYLCAENDYPQLLPELPAIERVEIEGERSELRYHDGGLVTVGLVDGSTRACAITRDGEVWCWNDACAPVPARVEGVANVIDVDLAGGFVWITRRDGSVAVATCGFDGVRQVADATNAGPDGVVVERIDAAVGDELTPGGLLVLARDTDGYAHRVTDTSVTASPFWPEQVSAISAGTFRETTEFGGQGLGMMCAIIDSGAGRCMYTFEGAWNDTATSGLPELTRIEQSSFVVCGRAVADGRVWCWGHEVVDGAIRDLPAPVPGTETTSDFSVNGTTLCLLVSGRVRCIDVGGGRVPALLPWMDGAGEAMP